jgi:hypothetical protein
MRTGRSRGSACSERTPLVTIDEVAVVGQVFFKVPKRRQKEPVLAKIGKLQTSYESEKQLKMNLTICDSVQQSPSEASSIDARSLYRAFEHVKDGRKARGKRYP